MPRWETRAACRGKPPEWFFPESGPGHDRAAKAVCAGCEVRDACLQSALTSNEQYGIRGGLTPPERQRMMDGAILRQARCKRCEMPFTFWWEKGKAPRYCSAECLRQDRNKSRNEWRTNRRLYGKIQGAPVVADAPLTERQTVTADGR